MRRVRVCIYGGTDIDGPPTAFISALAYRILDSLPAVIVTGGFVTSKRNPGATSTDVAALEGARRYASERSADLKSCFEAWIPEPSLDSRLDIEGVVRMRADEGITVRVATGRTDLGRRLAMVAGVDMVVTISGKVHTELVVEQAIELGVPVLPIPFADGDSEKLLVRYRSRIAAAFAPGALDRCLEAVAATFVSDPRRAADPVIELIRTAKVGKCLVLLPYDDLHDTLYASTIEPAVARHMISVRLDRLPRSEAIYTSFADAMRSSSAVIADITALNENVMYEVGYAHGSGLTPLIYTQDERRLEQLPVYFRTLNVRSAPDPASLRTLIDEYLQSLKSGRSMPLFSESAQARGSS